MSDGKKPYPVHLSSSRSWRLESSRGTERWVERFASFLGISAGGDVSSPAIVIVASPAGAGRDMRHSPKCGPAPLDAFPRQRRRKHWLPGLDIYWQPGSQDALCVLRDATGPDCELEQMRYALYPILDGAVRDGGLPLHAALIERDGRGVLIAAASGTGKSTCCRRLPHPWTVLADDMCLVVPAAGGGWRAHPLPTWSAIKAGGASWPCRINESVPVEALCFLVRSETDGAAPLGRGASALGISDGAAVCFSYLDRYFRSEAQRPLRKRIFENAAALAGTLPAFTLRASLTGRFWEEIETIPGSEVAGTGRMPYVACRALPFP